MKLMNQEDRIQIMPDEVNVNEIINDMTSYGCLQQDEPFYVFNIGDIIKKHQIWIEKMPRVIPHYAVKCNDNEIVLATLAALGTSFDCASKSEINKILRLGVKPERIIFANPTKPNSHIRHAANVNVQTMTFDCDIELHKIKIYCPDAKLVLRIRCEAEVAQCPLGKKFGCEPSEGRRLLKIAKSLGLDVVGISFHVGSGCADFPIYYKAIGMSKELFEFAETIGYNMNLLDIGGGFPGDNDKTIDDVAVIVNQALEDYFPDNSVRIIAEPGRFYVASAFTLITNVHSKKFIINPGNGEVEHVMYYINDGVYGSFNCILYDHQIVKPILLNASPIPSKNDRKYKSTIWGPSCDALDQILENIELPDIQIGDFIVFENMGAYTIPVASAFNGFPLPKVFPFISTEIFETLKSLIPLNDDYFIKPLTSENIICKTFENAVYG